MGEETLRTRVRDDPSTAAGARISMFSSSAPASPESEPPAISSESAQKPRSPSSKRETRSGAPGTFFAIQAFARIRICRHSATRFVRGTVRKRSPMALRFCAIWPKQRKPIDVDRHIRFGHKVARASWRSADARWALDVDGPDGEKLEFSCNFLFLCTGYYEYAEGHSPGWPGMERFAGRVVHPQKWPEDLQYDDKRVVVIGSGATAVTIVPAMAAKAAHVVMLQRSPTYVVARPAEEAMAKRLKTWLPARCRTRGRSVEEHPVADVPVSDFPAQTGRGAQADHQARSSRDRAGA